MQTNQEISQPPVALGTKLAIAIEARGMLAAGAVLLIEMSDDPNDLNAQHVRLESVELDEYP